MCAESSVPYVMMLHVHKDAKLQDNHTSERADNTRTSLTLGLLFVAVTCILIYNSLLLLEVSCIKIPASSNSWWL